MAVSTIKDPRSMKMHITYSSASGTSSLAAGATVDITTAWDLTGRDISGYVPIYAGNPKLVITNMWSASNVAKFTVFNPTSAAQTINHSTARIGVLYMA